MGRSDNGDDGMSMLPSLTTRAVMFSIAGLMALTLVGAGSWLWGQRAGTSQAISDARTETEALAARIVEANVIGGLLAGDPAAVQTVDRLVSEQGQTVVGVTLSSIDGHAIYSKNPAVLGTTTPLDETALQALQGGQPSVEMGVPSSPSGEPLLRVHQPTQPPSGETLLLQVDYDYRAVTAAGGRVWRTFAPVTLGTFLLLGVVWMCLGWLALRRTHNASRPFEVEDDDWLAPEPSRWLAPEPADLTTRAFQGREPVSAGVATHAGPQPSGPVSEPDEDGWLGELRGGAAWPAGPFAQPVPEDDVPLPGAFRAGSPEPRHSVEPLRPVPASRSEPQMNVKGLLRGNGAARGNGSASGNGGARGNGAAPGNGKPRSLETALSGMLLPLARRGIDTRLDLPPGLRLPSDTEELLLWAAEEAVRNTVTHSQASTVKVRLDVREHRVALTVDDDGRGFDPDELTRPSPNGQVSLRTLTQLAASAGGALRIHSAPNCGTRLHLDLPAV